VFCVSRDSPLVCAVILHALIIARYNSVTNSNALLYANVLLIMDEIPGDGVLTAQRPVTSRWWSAERCR